MRDEPQGGQELRGSRSEDGVAFPGTCTAVEHPEQLVGGFDPLVVTDLKGHLENRLAERVEPFGVKGAAIEGELQGEEHSLPRLRQPVHETFRAGAPSMGERQLQGLAVRALALLERGG